MRQYITDFNAFKAQSNTGAELKEKCWRISEADVPRRLDQAVDAAFPPAK